MEDYGAKSDRIRAIIYLAIKGPLLLLTVDLALGLPLFICYSIDKIWLIFYPSSPTPHKISGAFNIVLFIPLALYQINKGNYELALSLLADSIGSYIYHVACLRRIAFFNTRHNRELN